MAKYRKSRDKEGINMIYLGLIGILATGDQWLKHVVEAQEPEKFPRPLEGTKDRIWIYRNHNAGFPFGFLEQREGLVRTVPLILTSALAGSLFALRKKKGEGLRNISAALVIGGSLSNLYDRYVRGYVVDYLSLRVGPLKEVVFNLGDIFILLGATIHAVCMAGEKGNDAQGKVAIDKNKEIL